MSLLIDILAHIYSFMMISDTGSNLTFAIVAIFITAIIILNNHFKVSKSSIKNTPVLFLILFIISASVEILISGELPMNFVLSRWAVFFPVVLFQYYKDSINRERILKFIYIALFGVGVFAIYIYSSGIISARRLAAHLDREILFSGGGYGFAIASAIMAVYLLDMLLWKRMMKTIPIILLEIVLICVVFATQSTITIIALCIGVVASLVFRIFSVSSFRRLTRKNIVGILLVLALTICIFESRVIIGYQLMQVGNSGNGIVYRRLAELGSSIVGDSSVGNADYTARVDLLKMSIESFLANPMFGLTAKVGTNFYQLANMGVGSHGELFDALAKHGLFAGVFYICIFVSNFVLERKSQKVLIGYGYIVTVIILFLFNPCLYYPSNIIIFLAIPLNTRIKNSEE